MRTTFRTNETLYKFEKQVKHACMQVLNNGTWLFFFSSIIIGTWKHAMSNNFENYACMGYHFQKLPHVMHTLSSGCNLLCHAWHEHTSPGKFMWYGEVLDDCLPTTQRRKDTKLSTVHKMYSPWQLIVHIGSI